MEYYIAMICGGLLGAKIGADYSDNLLISLATTYIGVASSVYLMYKCENSYLDHKIKEIKLERYKIKYA